MAMTKPASTQVTFLQSGTGAVATTVQTKLRESVSVKDFGAVGDGTTDDTAAIQAAFNAALKVYFPASTGSYMVSTVTAVANGSYFGPGTIQRIAGAPGGKMFDVPYGANNVTIDGLGLIYATSTYAAGPITVGYTGGAINQTTQNVSIVNCRITGPVNLSRTTGAIVEGNNITNGLIYFTDWADKATVNGNVITHDVSYLANAISANNVDATPAQRGGISITNNVITTYRMGIEWRDWTTTNVNVDTRSIMANNTIRTLGSDASSFGISLNSDGWVINGNTLERVTAGTGYGIEIVASSLNVISSNIVKGYATGIGIYSSSAAAPARRNIATANRIEASNYGVLVYRYAEDTVVSNNHILFTTPAVYSATYRAISVDGDNGFPANGQLGTRQVYRTVVSDNNVICDTTGDANAYNYIQVSSAIDTLVKNNTVRVSGGNAGSSAVYVINADNLQISDNRFSFATGTSCPGIYLYVTCGRNLSITGNSFSGFTRIIEQAGGTPNYSINIFNNQLNNCSLAPRDFPSDYSYKNYTSKVAFNASSPTQGTWQAGDVVFNTGAGTGWKCSVSGTAGTLPTTTANTTSGLTTISLSTLNNIEEGQYISIAGVAGTKKLVSINRADGTAVIDVAAGATVASAAVAFVAPTFVALPF